jgi:TetR/AcrR family transcriptional regulator, transcriptional repressor for nem operon
VALVAAYEGIALLAAALRDPGLIGTEGARLERWIDSLAGSGQEAARS